MLRVTLRTTTTVVGSKVAEQISDKVSKLTFEELLVLPEKVCKGDPMIPVSSISH